MKGAKAMAKVEVSNKPPPNFSEELIPRISVEATYKGQPDRITVSLNTKVGNNGVFFSYSTDVGMYNKKETLKQARIRAFNYVKKIVIHETSKIK